MHTVRVYLNRQEGTTWWAEDDLGFTGGTDRLSDLIDKIHEWAGCEGVLDDLAVRLVSDPPEVPARTHAICGVDDRKGHQRRTVDCVGLIVPL